MSEEVKEVTKRGDWYTVKGVSNGREVSVDIPANAIDGKTRRDAIEQMKRGIKVTAEQE